MRIEKTLRELKEKNEKFLIIYLTAGDPDLETTEKMIYEIGKAGADLIELGVPFSDPLADGATIQQASQRALKKQVNIDKILKLVERVRKQSTIPIVLMGYFNPFYRYGLKSLAFDAKNAGVDGFIVPDLPLEESSEFKDRLEEEGLVLVSFLAPTSSPERIARIAQQARGFIYCVSVTGVTGVRRELSPKIAPFVNKIRIYTDLPVAVGFGVGNPMQAKEIAQVADGVIVGSAIVDIIESGEGEISTVLPKVNHFVSSLKEAIHREK